MSAVASASSAPLVWRLLEEVRDTTEAMLLRSRVIPVDSEPPAQSEAPTLALAYSRYVPYVAKLGLRLLGRPDEVDDLIQDVFVIASERFTTLRDPNALRGWLAGITVRTAVRRLRRRRIRRFISLDAEPEQLDLSPYLKQGASAEHRRLLNEVFHVLDKVPTPERVAWTLRVLEDEPVETVAELCECSLSTAKRRIAAAQKVIDKAVQR